LYPKSHSAAYLLSTAIFSAIHILGFVGIYSSLDLILAFVQYIPAGLILAWVYRRSGSIFAPILMHAMINAVGMFAHR
jgi:membrane protease YdiL (CAAX protease family)